MSRHLLGVLQPSVVLHVSLDTTHIYAEVDLEMKAKALALCDLPNDVATKPWHSDPGLMGFLRSL